METRYVVLEIQHFADNNVNVVATKHDARNDADAKFYDLCKGGCYTSLPIYTIVLMTTEGFVLDTKKFVNEVQPVQTTEPATE